MQLAFLCIFFVVAFTLPINAQDTLRYKDYIDYERRDHLAMAKNTIITRDGNFLPDGLYCFKGNKKDFELLLKTNRMFSIKKDIKIDNKSELYLIGAIKDSVKSDIWVLVIKNINAIEKSVP